MSIGLTNISKTVIRIWIRNIGTTFVYTDTPPSSVWGFFCQKDQTIQGSYQSQETR